MVEVSTPIEQIISNRKEKLQKICEAGINPYPSVFATEFSANQIQERYASLQVGESSDVEVSIAGRIVSRREMGKASFLDLMDFSGKIQLYFRSDKVGADSFKIFKDLVDISDFIGATGTPFRTKTGELSLQVGTWCFLSKTLRPLPEKWHGLKDTETRYRQRYLDLISNPEVKSVFVNRSTIISTLRRELENKGFLEVETPIMQSIPGGAAARPFHTHHNALNMDLYLRIAPELYLKRLVVGGIEKVFEIGRNFRNEGIDRSHNPEFTMLELYQAYVGYEEMMNLTEHLISTAAIKIGKEIVTPFKRVKFFDILNEVTGMNLFELMKKGELKTAVNSLKIDIPDKSSEKKILDHIFDKLVVPKLTEPTFVIDYPSIYSPLAKSRPDQKDIAERFELFVDGKEIANAYSELNDPQEQRKRFEDQMEARNQGDDEAQLFDEDFITALEHGLPPTGGLGIGIDRLVMILTKTESVREVILFPLLRSE